MTTPSTYPAVRDHLEEIINQPATPLDIPAIDKLRLELIANTDPNVAAELLKQISRLLPVIQQDPTPVTVLAENAAAYLTFSQIRAIDPPVSIIAGIQAPSPPVNILALSLLAKAGKTAWDAAAVSENRELVLELVELWLSTTATSVAQTAFDVLWVLLEVDYTPELDEEKQVDGTINGHQGGQGAMWKRVFNDRDIYERLFSICSLGNVGSPGQLSAREKSVAQGRLMDFLVKAGSLNWRMISTSQFHDIEAAFQSTSLLDFVVSHMIDQDDVLMCMTQIQFLCEFLKIRAPGISGPEAGFTASCPPFSSPALEFLVARDLHSKIMNFYLDPSSLDSLFITYLMGPVLGYISQYAILYPNHLLEQPRPFLEKLLSRITESFDIPSADWAHSRVPSGDLNILASLPRVLLLSHANPLLTLPSKPVNKDVLDTLGRIFRGPRIPTRPSRYTDLLQAPPTSYRAEASAARVLYLCYLNEHPDLWQNIVGAADILAMQDIALASLSFIKAVIQANWNVIKSDDEARELSNPRYPVLTEAQVSNLGPSSQGSLPVSGAWSILVPPALTSVLPYLFKPPQTYANFVAGGAADTESAVWRVATAKYDALVALQSELEKSGARGSGLEGFDELLATLEKRVADGPWGPQTQVGGRIEALEL